jgi:hypothetical protein
VTLVEPLEGADVPGGQRLEEALVVGSDEW